MPPNIYGSLTAKCHTVEQTSAIWALNGKPDFNPPKPFSGGKNKPPAPLTIPTIIGPIRGIG
eukprot:CAMPEP_0171465370 /NCGR_PEP_ID=MMETSP0945-20130129/8453_1 /TAXON_ID=109269 /ORGANISM="Vaucheria litorea, Strain CCMP2940" /LENGTH=61 /DNA_ID=CAMNT_0011992919 /DNA_START=649 /DNA_END=834 /DNA_ORIENTATION=-